MNDQMQQALQELAARGSDPGAAAVWERATGAAVVERVRRRRLRRRSLTSAVALVAAVAIVVAVALAQNTSHDHTLQVTPTAPTGSATVAQLVAGSWSTLPAAPIPVRDGASVVWTGTEMLVWGGASGHNQDQLHSDGAAFDPATNTWRVLPPAPLSPRTEQAAVWTGVEMIIWGGDDNTSNARTVHATNDGAAYNPTTNSWRLLPASPLAPRNQAIAVWTGNEMIVLGGQPAVVTDALRGFADGAAYDPAANRWRKLEMPVPPDHHPLTWAIAVQAGPGGLFAWSQWAEGHQDGPNSFEGSGGADLFQFNEATEHWSALAATADAIPAVEEAIWTGQRVIVRGIGINCGYCSHPFSPEITAEYDPATNGWKRLPADPLGGDHMSSTWTGAALFSFNGGTQVGPIGPGNASVYDPSANRWTRMPRAPFGCVLGTTPIWTGKQVLAYCADNSPTGAGSPSGLAFTPARTTAPIDTASCTSADLQARGNVPMPKPELLTKSIAYDGGMDIADPPSNPNGAKVTAEQAWQSALRLRFVGTSPVGNYRILLADYSKINGAGVSHRLAWLIVGHHVPGIGSGPGPGPSGTVAAQPPCAFIDVVDAVDAMTGQSLDLLSGAIHAP